MGVPKAESEKAPEGNVVEPASEDMTEQSRTEASDAESNVPAPGGFAYFRLLFYGSPKWVDVFLIIFGAITAAAAGVPFPLMGIVFGQLVDDLNGASCAENVVVRADDFQPQINDKVLLLVYLAIGCFVLIYLYLVSWSLVSQRLAHRLRQRYFESLLRQDATFFDTRKAGEVSSRLSADIQTIQSGTSEKVGVCIASLSFFLTAYIVGFVKDAQLAGILVSLVPAFFILGGVGAVFIQKFSGIMSDSLAAASSVASEALTHVSVVQAFGAAPRLEKKFAKGIQAAEKAGIKKAIAAAAQAGALYFVAFSANALAFWLGSRKIADALEGKGGHTTVGTIYTVVFIIVDGCIVIGQIAPILPLLGAAAAAFTKLESDICSVSHIDSTGDSGEKLDLSTPGAVEFRNVAFSYPSRREHPALRTLSLSCPAGKHTAIVGPSGSGKSTIVGLVTRLYDPSEGEILLDGHPLTSLNVRNLRSFVGIVQQEPSLLDRSILENIALGLVGSPTPEHEALREILLGPKLSLVASQVREGRDLMESAASQGPEVVEVVKLVMHAADLADATDFIERLQYKMGTLAGNEGNRISGGQRQRVALARALVRNPKILILDEATSSLDSASEQRIQESLEKITSGRTVISIAHRLSTIKKADNIIVLKHGEMIEQGTHAELIERAGEYAGLVKLQNIQAQKGDDHESVTSTVVDKIESAPSVVDSAQDAKRELHDAAEKDRGEQSAQDAPADDKIRADMPIGLITRKLLRIARPTLLFLLVAFFAATIVGGTYSASGVIFGNAMGNSSACTPVSKIRHLGRLLGGMFFMLAVVEFFANLFSWSCFGYVAEKLLYVVRILSFRTLFEQDLDFHQSASRSPAVLLSIITKDTAELGGFSGSIMGTVFSVVVNLLVAIILSHILAWKIAIVCLAVLPILLGAGYMQLRALAQFQERHSAAFANSVGITVEAVNSIKTIASLSIEKEVFSTYMRSLKKPRAEIIRASAYTNIWLAISNSVGYLIYAFAYWWGSKQIINGQYSQSSFFTILVAMLVGAQLWGQMFTLAPEVSRARSAASRILSLLQLRSPAHAKESQPRSDSESELSNEKDVEASGDMTKSTPRGNHGVTVKFNDVQFSYPSRPDVTILNNTSFEIRSGQFCGLVGPSGAGKSTIMALVQGLYKPSAGSVEIDGQSLGLLEGQSFRDDVAIVPQDAALFDGTIKFNVGLGARPGCEATQAQIEAACKLANMHETIMALPEGYDTECGPNGSRLSGGQRQRLAIARALVREPRLLLLDESTSALDAESERALQEGLEVVARGITVIAITHRLHTVRKADVILVVEGGKIADRGSHDELMERSERYRSNANHQMLGS